MTLRAATAALACAGVAALAVAVLSACGGSSDGSGPPTLSWFVAIQPGGTIETVAERCSKESGGRYKVEPEFLPTDASQQREQLVRRLGAEDPSIDIIGMDVIWTGEFANAGWVEEWKGPLKQQVTEEVFSNVIETASFEGKLYAAPFNTNTQLLWYRKDLVPKPPDTWDEMIDQAEKLGRDNAGTIQVQANRYEGFMVWVNALIESAGDADPLGPGSGRPEAGPDRKGARGDGPAGQLLRRAAEPLDLRRGHRPARLRGGRIGLHDQLHLRLRERPGEAPGHRQGDGLCPLSARSTRASRANHRSAASTSRSAPSRSTRTSPSTPRPAWPDGKSQLTAVELDGLPPSRSDLYTDKVVTKAYPGFAALVKESIEESGAAADDARLPGRLARGPAHAAPAGQDRPRRHQLDLRRAEVEPRRRRQARRALLMEASASATRSASAAGSQRTRSERRLAWMLCAPAVIAMLARHRLPDRLRDRPLAAADRPALPRRERLRRPRQLHRRCSAPSSGGPTSSTPSS